MQLFGVPLSPFVRKVMVVAAEKGVVLDLVPANGRAPSPEFLAASPFRKMPALRDGDYTLADSSAIVTYIDALHPQPPIFPAEARARGTAIWFEEFADTILSSAMGKIMFNRLVGPRFLGIAGDEAAAQQGEQELRPMLDYLESAVPADGWLAGSYSIGDIAVASSITTLGYVGIRLDGAAHPRATAWLARVSARPAWQLAAEQERAMMAAFG